MNKPPKKWVRVLSAFVAGRRLTRFDAAVELRDWCLNSTVAELEGRGIAILREPVTVPGVYGPVHCRKYQLAPDSFQIARELLEREGAQESAA